MLRMNGTPDKYNKNCLLKNKYAVFILLIFHSKNWGVWNLNIKGNILQRYFTLKKF